METGGFIRVIKKRSLHDGESVQADLDYWLARPAADRIAAVELLRKQVYGDYPEGLQRVYRIARLPRR